MSPDLYLWILRSLRPIIPWNNRQSVANYLEAVGQTMEGHPPEWLVHAFEVPSC